MKIIAYSRLRGSRVHEIAEIENREDEKKGGETRERKGGGCLPFSRLRPLFPDHALIFSRAFHLHVIPTTWEPGTGYEDKEIDWTDRLAPVV